MDNLSTTTKIKDYIKQEILFIIPTKWRKLLLKENTNLTVKGINKKYIDKNIIRFIEESIIEDQFCITDESDIYVILKMFSGLFFYYKDLKIIGAVDFDIFSGKGEKILDMIFTDRFEVDYPDTLVTIFKLASQRYKAWLISDHTDKLKSSSIWFKFLSDPDEYGIKEIYTDSNRIVIKF